MRVVDALNRRYAACDVMTFATAGTRYARRLRSASRSPCYNMAQRDELRQV
jgi:hypothetical protein